MTTVRSLLTVLLVACLLAGPAMAGSADDPEVSDERGDVDAQHLADADVLDQDTSVEELETSGDIVKAWIDKETADAFQLEIELADIPDEKNVSSPLVEVWAHFTIREGDFHALARLSSPQEGSPTQGSYELYEGSAKTTELAGDVDVEKDRVSLLVPKPVVNDPTVDDALSKFYVTTHTPVTQAPLDYAPGTNKQSLPGIDQAESADPTSLELSASPNHGRPYTFQVSDDITSEISVTITPSSLEVPAGDQATFSIRVDNDGDRADEVSLSLSNTPAGWSADIRPGSLSVDASSSETAKLHVTPPGDAEGHELIDVRVVSDRGADKGATASVVAVQPDDPGSSSEDPNDAEDGADDASDDDTDASEQPEASEEEKAGNESEESNGVPFVSPWLGLTTIAGLALLLRRRRA